MKSLTLFAMDLLTFIGKSSGIDTQRDVKTITARTEGEGFSFLTITLPAFCKAVEKSLASGSIVTSDFTGFRAQKSGELPAFLQGFLSIIFDSETGLWKSDCNFNGDSIIFNDNGRPSGCLYSQSPMSPCTSPLCKPFDGLAQGNALRSIRQICLVFSKVMLETTSQRRHEAVQKYIRTEEEVKTTVICELDWARFLTDSSRSFWEMLSQMSTLESTMESYVPATDLVPPRREYLEIPSGFSVSGPSGWKTYFLFRNTHLPTTWTVYTVQSPFLISPRN